MPFALSCAEIPLLISDKDCSLPILDSTRILSRAALAGSRESLTARGWCGASEVRQILLFSRDRSPHR